ncbi:MAG: hypothetical protein ACW99F_03415 [Candidatus Hodarchaeales archaeon]|jgi:hypothetical protein
MKGHPNRVRWHVWLMKDGEYNSKTHYMGFQTPEDVLRFLTKNKIKLNQQIRIYKVTHVWNKKIKRYEEQ